MSKVYDSKTFKNRYCACVVQTNDKRLYYVDAEDAFDVGWEVMVFECTEDSPYNYAIDYSGVYQYNSNKSDVLDRYNKLLTNLEDYIKNDDEEWWNRVGGNDNEN